MNDVIYRQAALDALGERPMVWTDDDYVLGARNQYDMDRLAIETVPSAQPEPIRLRLDHELSKEEYERLKKDCAEQPIILLPKESAQPGEDIRAMCGECDAWNQYKNYPQPGWIPTSKRLPKTEEKVLITCEHLDIYGKPHRYVCKAYHVDRYTMRSDVDWWDEGCDEYREEDDQYYVLEGWYECIHNWGDYSSVRITEDKVVAWCESPTPYREGEPNE